MKIEVRQCMKHPEAQIQSKKMGGKSAYEKLAKVIISETILS